MTDTFDPPMIVVERSGGRPPGVLDQVREVLRYRELLGGLVVRDLKVKYRGSALGFLWSLLMPLLQLGVFYLAFDVFLGSGIPAFPVFLLSGLLVWNLFSAAIAGAAGSVVGNAGLVNKVYFPRLVLPLSAVGSAVVHFFLQSMTLLVAISLVGYHPHWSELWALVPALLAVLSLATGLAIWLSATNVRVRDTQHLIDIGLQAWFWVTPIVFQYQLVYDRIAARESIPNWLPLLNPVTPIVLLFQRVVHNKTGTGQTGVRPSDAEPVLLLQPDNPLWWHLRNVTIVFLLGLVICWFAIRSFSQREGDFAEEL